MIKAILFCSALLIAGLAQAGSVNINQADAVVLSSELNGIGEKKAQAIVDYRTQHGPFNTLEDLQNVKGIGDQTIEKNRDKMTL
ncbi:MAG TPA: ComEA family DNA-binding protein [Gammaproteobacteria bacterium]